MSTPEDAPYKLRRLEWKALLRPRLIADSREIRNDRLELRKGLSGGKMFIQRPERQPRVYTNYGPTE